MKLGFALGGGGARGSAHLGALKALFALGFKPDLITGTSVGGLVGALLGAGFSIDEMANLMASLKPSVLYALPSGGMSVTSAERIEGILKKYLYERFSEEIAERVHKYPRFSDLDIPLAVIATDLVSQREVVLDEGRLIKALVATSAIPILFPPVPYGEMRLVDGGLVNNLPIDVARSRGATFTIAIDLSHSAPYGTQPTHTESESIMDMDWSQLLDGSILDRALHRATRRPLWQVITAVMDIVNAQNTNLNLAVSPPDVLIRPYLGTIGLLDFHTVEEGMEAGRKAVHQAAPELEKLLTSMEKMREAEASEEDGTPGDAAQPRPRSKF